MAVLCVAISTSIVSIDYIDSIDSILVPHKRPPTFTPHTKGRSLRSRKQQYRWGRRLRRRPHRYCCFSLCVWCECWRSFVWHEYRIYRIYKIYRIYRVCRVFRLYRVYRVYTVYRAYRIYRIVRIAHNILRSKHTSKKRRFIIRLFSPRSLRKNILRI